MKADGIVMSVNDKHTNFLNNRLLNKFLKSPFYPRIFQWITVIVFAVIMFETLAGPTDVGENFDHRLINRRATSGLPSTAREVRASVSSPKRCGGSPA